MSEDPGAPDPDRPVDIVREAAFDLGGARVLPATCEVLVGGATLRLQPKVMQVLVALARARGELVSRDSLVASCWGGMAISEDALSRCIQVLRRLSEEDAAGTFTIETIPRAGYRLRAIGETAAIRSGPPPPPPPRPAAQPAGVDAEPATEARAEPLANAGAVAPIAPWRRAWPPRLGPVAWALAATILVGALVGVYLAARPLWTPDAASPSIAVLPFANLSGDPRQDYFSDGLAEELLDRLERVPRLRVAARTSSFVFKNSKADSRTIADRLGVAYILDGSVRREANRLRISAHLVDARTGFETWSQTYDRDFNDVLQLQSGIAESVAEALRIRLGGVDRAAMAKGGTTVAEAYDRYLRGRSLFKAEAGEASDREALMQFDAAVSIDPTYAAAYAMRARTLLRIANYYAATAELRPTYEAAAAAARRAVELAPGLAEAQAAVGDALYLGGHDFRDADAAYARAMTIGGAGDAEILSRYGVFENQRGRPAAGLAALRRAVTLDPLNARAFKALGQGLLGAGQFDQAVTAFQHALELNPAITLAHGGSGDALLMLGRLAEARREYALEPVRWQSLTGEAMVAWRLGDPAAARAALRELIKTEGDNVAYQEAQIHAQWGDRDGAFAALDKAFRTGDGGVAMLRGDPLMTPLRQDPRFAALARRLDAPD